MIPIVMVKNGKEYFVINQQIPQPDYENDRINAILKHLSDTDGKYARFNGFFKEPMELLQMVEERNNTFVRPDKLFSASGDGEYVDFHGNLREVSAAFKYRIYDMEYLEQLKNEVKRIKEKNKKRGKRNANNNA